MPELGKIAVNLIPEKNRQFHVFCVGLPRSGTHSLANLFRLNYRADHEPYHGATVKLLIDLYKNKISKDRIINHLKVKDEILQLELEAAHYLYKLVPELVSLFPESKFILTVREPRSWLESEINMNYRSVRGKIWSRLEYARYDKYGFEYKIPKLKNIKGVYPISSYLHYYLEHIDLVLKSVPPERLLILDTFNLNGSIDKLCDFTGADKKRLNFTKIHSSKNSEKQIHLNESVSEDVLNKKIEDICKKYICKNLPVLEKYI
ncbi:MAG: sulfotransferase [Balneolaceae bacterium]|nr:sulfotransferase [Balneolaceae bacterium]